MPDEPLYEVKALAKLKCSVSFLGHLLLFIIFYISA